MTPDERTQKVLTDLDSLLSVIGTGKATNEQWEKALHSIRWFRAHTNIAEVSAFIDTLDLRWGAAIKELLKSPTWTIH